MLTLSFDDLTALQAIHKDDDDAAVAIIAKAAQSVVELRDHYANGAPEPLHQRAAQELRELSDFLRKTGEESGNDLARRALAHESERITAFIMTSGIMGADGEYLFTQT